MEPAESLEGEREPSGNAIAAVDAHEDDFAGRMRAQAQAHRSRHGQSTQQEVSSETFCLQFFYAV